SSLAYCTVSELSAVFDGTYVADAGIMSHSPFAARSSDPTELDTLTITAAAERRSSGSMALVTVRTPNTLVSNTRRSRSRSIVDGAGPLEARRGRGRGVPAGDGRIVDEHIQPAVLPVDRRRRLGRRRRVGHVQRHRVHVEALGAQLGDGVLAPALVPGAEQHRH